MGGAHGHATPLPERAAKVPGPARGASAPAVTAARVRLTPLEDRLATVPVELQREGLSLVSLQASLRGRWRGNAHPGDLGAALRRLGFKRRRQWRDGASYRALWYPT